MLAAVPGETARDSLAVSPRLGAGRCAAPSLPIQIAVWIGATVVLTVGVAALHLGHDFGEPIAIAGSLVILGDMLFFAVLVFWSAATAKQVHELALAE